MTARGLLIAGTSSDAGKSSVTTGLCRVLHRRGIRVAPFKAQNMSNNSMVCPDGTEIGRAQYLQAQAARATPESAMNPVLLKPGSDRRSHIVVRGRPAGELASGEFATGRRHLAQAAFAAYEELAEKYDVVVSEGAGSPAEINLRSGDYVNLGLARRFDLPVMVVGDIDRGGVLASLYGTVALLDDADRALVRAFLINKFRGDVDLLRPGLDEITRRTGVPFLGVLPWLDGVWLDGEDTLAVGRWASRSAVDAPDPVLRVAVVRMPRLSNATDVDALAAEPGVAVSVVDDPVALRSADVIVLPGSRSTVGDLAWLRRTGLADEVLRAVAAGTTVVGICGGYQMLGRTIRDGVESSVAEVDGLGLLPTDVRFAAEKSLGTPSGSWHDETVDGYEIHHGVATVDDGAEPFLDGCRVGPVWGTMWHGIFENDGFRRRWLAQVAAERGRATLPAAGIGYRALRESMIDALADAVEAHVDVDAVIELIGARG
ncbi:cobyric acid synthase [Nakamurella flava]|uniref:Cobyric acid synthase n=1 Tax=Nakamurella flava TaxID=2576308 RepID=A0A4U6QEH1_9ACTN|nr:cobyric acid synthase [Nakamurella flava]TKV58386.1 cobyric acid synthase [Nakamurella flava]